MPRGLTYFFGCQIAHVGFTGLDELHGPFVELIEIIGGVIDARPLATQPADVFDDRIDVLGFLFRWIRVVEAQIAFAAEFVGQSEIQVNRFGVADVKIAVRLRWKAGVNATLVLTGLQIAQNDVADKIRWRGGGRLRRMWRIVSYVVHTWSRAMAWSIRSRRRLAAEHGQRFKQRRRNFAAADRDPNRLEHLAGLDFHVRRGGAQSGVQSVVIEFRGSQGFPRLSQHCQRRVAASPFCGISSAGS